MRAWTGAPNSFASVVTMAYNWQQANMVAAQVRASFPA